MAIHTKQIQWLRQSVTLACDGLCAKAWGVNCRPREQFDSADADDFAFLADAELGTAPADPGTYEGGYGKPDSPEGMNKWCARECERSTLNEVGEPVAIKDLSMRSYNKPGKHPQA